jgi:exosortase/archaeosortase family protein
MISSVAPPSATDADALDRDSTRRRRSLLWRACGFLAAFAVQQLWWQSVHGTRIERFVVHDLIVRPAAALVNQLTPTVHAEPVGSTLCAPGGGLHILNGCEGTEALFLLVAAFAVVPLTWRWRIGGVLSGVVLVFVTNQARILALFYAYRANHAVFDQLHGTLTPVAVVLIVLGYFYAWLHIAERPASTA